MADEEEFLIKRPPGTRTVELSNMSLIVYPAADDEDEDEDEDDEEGDGGAKADATPPPA